MRKSEQRLSEHEPTPLHELEEAAQGQDLYRSPGRDLQLEDARDQAEASGWLPPDTVYEWPSVDDHHRIVNRRQDFYEAMCRLEARVARASRTQDWVESVAAALSGLEAALHRHIAEIEEPDGLFVEVVIRAPHLESDVSRLRRDHENLLSSCLSALEVATGAEVDIAELRRKVLGLLGRLAMHRQRGSELLYDAYNLDLAAAD